MLKRRTLRIVEEALRNRDGTLWLIVFMGRLHTPHSPSVAARLARRSAATVPRRDPDLRIADCGLRIAEFGGPMAAEV